MKSRICFIVFIILSIISTLPLNAQESKTGDPSPEFKYKSFLLTHDFFFTLSFNYEQLFQVAEKSKFGYRLGLGNDYGDLSFEAIGGAIYLYGKKKHFLEAGVALEYPFYYREEGPDPPTLLFMIGYRYQNSKGLILKIYPEFMPAVFPDEDSWGHLPFLGFSIGYAFK